MSSSSKSKRVGKSHKPAIRQSPESGRVITITPSHPLYQVHTEQMKCAVDRKLSQRVRSDSKSASSEAASVSIGSMLVDPKAVYRFRVGCVSTMSTSAGGTLQYSWEWDPSIVAPADWTSLSSLFTEVMLESAYIHLAPKNFASVVTQCSNALIGSNIGASSATPANLAAVGALSDAKWVNWIPNGGQNAKFSFKSPNRPNSLWANTAAPSPAIDTGCFGTFWVYNSTVALAPASEYIFDVLLELWLLLRGRF